MEFLFHFIFQIFKIFILGSIYGFLILIIYQIISKKRIQSKMKFWVLSTFSIFIFFFWYMFSFWGNHGMGDSARIPVGNNFAVENINWMDEVLIDDIRTSDNKQVITTQFKINKNTLSGNLDHGFEDGKYSYFIYDFKNNKLVEFESESDFNKYSKQNNLPISEELKSFQENYHDYWGGWRFWLLP